MADKRKGMPTKSKIWNHWYQRLNDLGKEWMVPSWNIQCDDSDYNIYYPCFACGWQGLLHRAHILPICEGGNNDPENLHLLCTYCHWDSETFYGKVYWEWFNFMGPALSSSWHAAEVKAVFLSRMIRENLGNDVKMPVDSFELTQLIKQLA